MNQRKHECLDCGHIAPVEKRPSIENCICDYICSNCSSTSVYLYASEEDIKEYEQKVLCMNCGKHDFSTHSKTCSHCNSPKITPEETVMARVFLNSLNV